MNCAPARPLESAKTAILVLHSALTVESEYWPLGETESTDLETLRGMKSITSKSLAGEDQSWTLGQDEKDEWLKDYRSRLAFHLAVGVTRELLSARMRRVMFAFKMFGFNEYYAGYEGHFRSRFCNSVGPGSLDDGQFSRVADGIWNDATTQREAANYMTYTDYHDAELQRCGIE